LPRTSGILYLGLGLLHADHPRLDYYIISAGRCQGKNAPKVVYPPGAGWPLFRGLGSRAARAIAHFRGNHASQPQRRSNL